MCFLSLFDVFQTNAYNLSLTTPKTSPGVVLVVLVVILVVLGVVLVVVEVVASHYCY